MNTDIKQQLGAALIIEQQPLIQSQIKYALQKIGFQQVDNVDRSLLAIRTMRQTYYSLILCSSDLNKGADGFQLFEQLKQHNLLKTSTTFVFMSSDQDLHLSQSIIELKPDEFLLKPFNSIEFEQRIQKVLFKKLLVKDVLTAIDKRKYSDAVKLINEHISNNRSAALNAYLMKLKGEIILELKNWPAGELFFTRVLEISNFSWAQLGYLECLIHLGKHNQARPLLEDLTQNPQTKLQALELLAKLEQAHHDYESALMHLKLAANIASRNIDRLQHVADLARITHDFEAEYNAHTSIIRHIKNSIHETPDAYLAAARSAIDYGLTAISEEESSRLAQTGLNYLVDMKQTFPNSKMGDQIEVTQARIFNLRNNSQKARQLLAPNIEKLERDLKTVNPHNIEDALDMAKALHELGFYQQSESLFAKIAEVSVASPELGFFSEYIQAEKQLREEIKDSPKTINNNAVDYFRRGRFMDALESFELAFKVMPKNPTIALNLLQSAIESHQTLNENKANYIVERCLKTISQSNLSKTQQERYEKLQVLMQKRLA